MKNIGHLVSNCYDILRAQLTYSLFLHHSLQSFERLNLQSWVPSTQSWELAKLRTGSNQRQFCCTLFAFTTWVCLNKPRVKKSHLICQQRQQVCTVQTLQFTTLGAIFQEENQWGTLQWRWRYRCHSTKFFDNFEGFRFVAPHLN